jgi:glycine/D-amino acid oxidase-like deaminating enzyme
MDQPKIRCLVAGGGPAGMMLGYLLARSGVQVLLVDARPLRNGRVGDEDLRAVQKRREAPTKVAQWLQGAQTANLARLSKNDPPQWMLPLLSRSAPIKRLLGRITGFGFRREHITIREIRDDACQ